jgi:hypothetical protein
VNIPADALANIESRLLPNAMARIFGCRICGRKLRNASGADSCTMPLKEAHRAVQVRAIKGVVENKNPNAPAATRALDGTF